MPRDLSRLFVLCASLAVPGTLLLAADDVDADGFRNPMQRLHFNPRLDQREFERSSFAALNVYDPFEAWNRRVYHFNYRADQWLLLPLVDGYRKVTPGFVRSGIHNVFRNLGEVLNLFNSLLQFKGKRALDSTGRLLINTTLGLAGLWDPATRMGLQRHNEDFGQTLGFYGVPAGPYLMLPLLGPSNLRDGSGLVVDFSLDSQVDWLGMASASDRYPALHLLKAIDTRDNTAFRYGQTNSPFEYEKIRYVYHEARQLQIAD